MASAISSKDFLVQLHFNVSLPLQPRSKFDKLCCWSQYTPVKLYVCLQVVKIQKEQKEGFIIVNREAPLYITLLPQFHMA